MDVRCRTGVLNRGDDISVRAVDGHLLFFLREKIDLHRETGGSFETYDFDFRYWCRRVFFFLVLDDELSLLEQLEFLLLDFQF